MKLIAVALPMEAAPIIKALKLKQIEKRAFTLYGNESYRLIVTGIGKMAMAAAVSYLYALSQDVRGFVNFGLAGHPTLAIGSFVLAHKITDSALNKHFYPHIPKGFMGETHQVVTKDMPELEYPQNVCYEMEASAFFQTAMRFTSIENIHVAKVISDNRLFPFAKEKAGHLIEQNLNSFL
ncbi:MAG TPA: hypothetical protein VLG44_03585, partial [Chlamydiales bacterium]|nr:hypothetical protein [Chlamydiales bacterium]